MSARMQIDKTINQIITQSFNMLKFRPIFEDYDKYRSKNSEYLDVITHTNELQQLRENTYYKQTTDDLKANYGEIFDDIGEIALNLERNRDEETEIHALKNKVRELELSHPYLKEKVFNSEAKNVSPDVQETLKQRSHYEFILSKARLKAAITRYFRNNS